MTDRLFQKIDKFAKEIESIEIDDELRQVLTPMASRTGKIIVSRDGRLCLGNFIGGKVYEEYIEESTRRMENELCEEGFDEIAHEINDIILQQMGKRKK